MLKRYEMTDPAFLCMGCMRILPRRGMVCSYCGFDLQRYTQQRSPRVLPPHSLLAGRYIVGAVLGEGGFGITYIGWDLRMQCRIAIKEYFPPGIASRDTRTGMSREVAPMTGEAGQHYTVGLRNFEREGRALARFRDFPGIVSVRDFFRTNRTAYIIMEYVEGITLKQYLSIRKKQDAGPVPEYEILEMMRPVLESLERIHREGIVHRDISPENILKGRDGKITLIDFGAARAINADDTGYTVVLKRGYAPIEQYRSRGNQGPWTDVYAVCATMYELASGKQPQDAMDRVYDDRIDELYLSVPGISRKFSDVIARGMRLQQEERYQTIRELYQDLFPTRMEETREPIDPSKLFFTPSDLTESTDEREDDSAPTMQFLTAAGDL